MITREITIAGKAIFVAYCYATEIAYKDFAGEDMTDYIKHAIESINAQRDPDIKRTIYAILAAMMAYYNSHNEEPPVTDSDLMNEAKPAELGVAIFTILDLRNQFYRVPSGEPEDKTEEGGNAKN